jgi:hypothetical protein
MESNHGEVIVISSDDEESISIQSTSIFNSDPIILSLDVGFKNLGIFMYDPAHSRVLEWDALDLSISKFEPEKIIEGVQKALEPYLSNPEILRKGCHVLVEKQTRMLKVYKVGLVDMAIRAWLAGKGKQATTVDPKKVKKFFKMKWENHRQGKTLAVKKARELIEKWTSDKLSDDLRNRFLKAKKKDDMADAMLQWMFYSNSSS